MQTVRATDKRMLGFTLIEMVIVLVLISILAAILTPIFETYLDRARYEEAKADVENIGAAMIEYNCDTRMWPIYPLLQDIPDGPVYNLLAGPGNQPAVASTIPDWAPILASSTTTTSLDGMLNTNYFLSPTNGEIAWKGPYLQLGPDPWGNSYYVTAANLSPESIYTAYIISAGPNQMIETLFYQYRQNPLVVGGDDIVFRLR